MQLFTRKDPLLDEDVKHIDNFVAVAFTGPHLGHYVSTGELEPPPAPAPVVLPAAVPAPVAPAPAIAAPVAPARVAAPVAAVPAAPAPVAPAPARQAPVAPAPVALAPAARQAVAPSVPAAEQLGPPAPELTFMDRLKSRDPKAIAMVAVPIIAGAGLLVLVTR